MSALSPILSHVEGGRVAFHCPGCGYAHSIPVRIHTPTMPVPDPDDPNLTPPREFYEVRDGCWSWNGSATKPTFQPSLLVTWSQGEPPVTAENLEEFKRNPWPQTKVPKVCHSFVTDGCIQFLGDCTHTLVGQTVAIPPW